jgi:hypothetical protein
MKKKILIFSLFASIFCVVFAQNESAIGVQTSLLNQISEYTVIRNWQNMYNITAHSDMTQTYQPLTYFAKTDFGMRCAATGSLSAFDVYITDSILNLRVYDMQFVDNYCFFCGYIMDTITPDSIFHRGVLGYYDVTELVASNMLNIKMHVYDTVWEFHKLVAYYEASEYKVVALGTNRWVLSSGVILHPSCVIEETPLVGFTSNSFVEFEFDSLGNPREYVNDLVLTNEYIVLVGYIHSNLIGTIPYNTLCVRLANRHNPLSGMITTRYQYNTGAEEVNDNVCASYISNEMIAVSYVHPWQPIGSVFSTRMRTIKIPSMLMSSSQEFPTYMKDNPIDMAYDPNNRILTMLHAMPFSTLHSYNQSYFVQLDPMRNPPYTAPVLIPQDSLYSTLDMFGGEYYVAAGKNRWYYQHTVAPQPNANECPEKKTITVKPLSNITMSVFSDGSFGGSAVNTDIRNVMVHLWKLELQCDDE